MTPASILIAAARNEAASRLTIRQAALLASIGGETWGSSELATHLGIQKPSVTRAVQSLAKVGLVHNGRDKADGRHRQIRLTGAGLAMLAEMEAAHA